MATLHNGGNVAVRSVRFLAALSRVSERPVSGYATGELRAIPIPPGTRAAVAANLMPANDALSIGGAGRVDVVCSLFSVDFADGTSWSAAAAASGSSMGATVAGQESPERTPGKPFVRMDFVTSGGRRPALGVEPGSMARMESADASGDSSPRSIPTTNDGYT